MEEERALAANPSPAMGSVEGLFLPREMRPAAEFCDPPDALSSSPEATKPSRASYLQNGEMSAMPRRFVGHERTKVPELQLILDRRELYSSTRKVCRGWVSHGAATAGRCKEACADDDIPARRGEMAENRFRVVYDTVTNMLYVTTDRASPSAARADAIGHLSCFCIDGEALGGVKTTDVDTYWGGRFDALPRWASPRPPLTRSAAAR